MRPVAGIQVRKLSEPGVGGERGVAPPVSSGAGRVNWDQIRDELEAAVRAQSVKVLDDAIEYLQDMRARLLSGEMVLPPPAAKQPETDPPSESDPQPERVPIRPTQPDPPAPVRRDAPPTKIYTPRTCEQCGNEFVPTHHRTKLCSDECRERRAMNRKNGMNMTFKRLDRGSDADQVQLETQNQELAEKFAPSYTRREPGSNAQSAPRVKVRPRPLPPDTGGDPSKFLSAPPRVEPSNVKPYAEYRQQAAGLPTRGTERYYPPDVVRPNTPEAASAIERAKADTRREAAEDRKSLVHS
jgi:hypothetical protein